MPLAENAGPGRGRYDLLVVGGGINGAGIARDAAGRGLSVCLCEAGDLAGGTSSASTKLIHGGLRYLEHYAFGLVRDALFERERLWAIAPHLIEPLRLVLPHHKGLRPAWLLRAGLLLYDYMGGRERLPPTRTLNLRKDPAGVPLKDTAGMAFEFSDCRTDDARLVVLNARDAADRGADILTRTRVAHAEQTVDGWAVRLEDTDTGASHDVSTRILVNAAGPWADMVLRDVLGQADARNLRLVRGSHIVVPSLFDHDRAYFFQNSDGRVLFAIPYQGDFTLIGTTDADHGNVMVSPRITDSETRYLCEMASAWFERPISPEMVVWSYSGVRALYDDQSGKAQDATRDYVVRADRTNPGAVLINIFGGKLTTYRKLAEKVLEECRETVPELPESWTGTANLPGGDMQIDGFEPFAARLASRYAFLPDRTIKRIARSYGTLADTVLGNGASLEDLGQDFGAGLFEVEVRYLVDQEWARTADDILWRRTKLGLRVGDAEKQALAAFLAGLRT